MNRPLANLQHTRKEILLIPFTVLGAGLLLGLAITMQTLPAYAIALAIFSLALLLTFLVRPDFVIPSLIFTIPLEISKTYFPFLLLDKDVDGSPASIIDLSRIVLLVGGIAFVALVLAKGANLKGILTNRAVIWSMILLAFCIGQGAFFSPSRGRAFVEVVRLGSYVITMVMVASLLNSPKRIELVLQSLILCGAILASVGLYQYAAGDFFWNRALMLSGMTRINVTFADPNILARYLAVVAFVTWSLTRIKLMGKTFLVICIALDLHAMLFTFSRSGWLLFPAGIGVYWWFSKGQEKAKVALQGSIAGGLLAVVLLSSAALKGRAESFAIGEMALGQRIGLVRTGLQMYKDHPLAGIGIGSFEYVAKSEYSELLPYRGQGVTLSHTSAVTLLAELGSTGAIIALLIFKATYDSFRRVLGLNDRRQRSIALSCFVGIVLIVLSAQAEGRMFEEPMLWVFLGILIALERIRPNESLPAG